MCSSDDLMQGGSVHTVVVKSDYIDKGVKSRVL
jgi:hypothetical protein